MGHYLSIKTTAKISKIGYEILSELKKQFDINPDKALENTAKELTQYPIVEAIYNRHNKWFYYMFHDFDENQLKIDYYGKQRCQDYFLDLFLPYLISEPCEIKFWMEAAFEDTDYNKKYLIEPKNVIIDEDRRFGDPTGIEDI